MATCHPDMLIGIGSKMLSGYERGQLVKEAFLAPLWNAARLALYGGGPWGHRISTATKFLQKSPIAHQAVRQGLMFGGLGGTLNVVTGAMSGDKTPWYQRYIQGFVPGALGGAAWGAATTGLAKGLSKLYQPGKKIEGFKQRVGAWGTRSYEQARNEALLAAQGAKIAPGNARAMEKYRAYEKELEERLRRTYGPTYVRSIFERNIPLAERAKRFGTTFGLGALSLGAGIGASTLGEKLSPISSEYPTTISGATYQTVRPIIPGSFVYGFQPTPQIGQPGMSYY